MMFKKIIVTTLLLTSTVYGQGLTSRQLKASTIKNGSGVLTLPSSTDTLVGRATTDTMTNKTLTAPIISTISNTGTLTLPTSTDTLVGRATTDSLTNKTLTAPVISTISNTGTLTLPTSTDTLVGRATTDTLTNKTLTSPTIDAVNFDDIVTPSNPSANFYKLYFKNDGNLYKLNSAGTEAAVGGANAKVFARACILSGSQSISTAAATKVEFNSETNDTHGAFDPVTNFRFTAPITDSYSVKAGVYINGVTAGQDSEIRIYKNGTAVRHKFHYIDAASSFNDLSDDVQLSATDYIEIFITSGGDTSYTVEGANPPYSCVSIMN